MTKIDWGQNLKKDHVTLTMPILMVTFHCRLKFNTVHLQAKFDDSSFSRSRDIIGGIKI